MSAATENRNDGGLGAGLRPHELYMGWNGPIAASAKIPNGTIAAATSLAPGSAISTFTTGASKIALGFVDAGWDNTGGVQGAHPIAVNQRTGTLIDLNAGGGSAIAASDARKICYLADNQTCSKLAADGEAAGMIFGLDPQTGRPVVGIGPVFLMLARAFAAATVAGLTVLTDNSGGAAADGVIGAVTAPTALTNSTGGSADGTLAAVGVTNTGDRSSDINNNFTELATAQAANRLAIVALTDAVKELSTRVNAIVTSLR